MLIVSQGPCIMIKYVSVVVQGGGKLSIASQLIVWVIEALDIENLAVIVIYAAWYSIIIQ